MLRGIRNKARLFLGLKNAPADCSSASLIFYYGPKFKDSVSYNLLEARQLLKHAKFAANKLTVLYIFGYLEHTGEESVHVIVSAYLQREDINLILLDWRTLAEGNYAFDAVVNLKHLGAQVAATLIELFDNELDPARFHIVGHSLGGQMAGVIGREVQAKSNKTKKIKRISALDPAFPLFYIFRIGTPLSSGDAEFVDVIHTDAYFYGAPFSTGTADFWPNSGKTLQPGCPKRNYRMLTDNDLSSHRRSWWFWAESVTNKHAEKFNAVKAKSWSDFQNGKLLHSGNFDIFMGHDCPPNITGDFYLQTNGRSPFARGRAGTIYVDPSTLPGVQSNEVFSSVESFNEGNDGS